MSASCWTAVHRELATTADSGPPAQIWLRDDDAVAVTPALERLAALCGEAGLPILLAVVPARAEPALAEWLRGRPGVQPCQHGWTHANHAVPGERACELGGARDDDAVLGELGMGRAAMDRLFRTRAVPILVPPWNRIRASLLDHLPDAGFSAVSTFAGSRHSMPPGLAALDADLDIIDWKRGRRGRPIEDLCARLTALVIAARQTRAPIGILTHHLAHDEAAWAFVDELLRQTRGSGHVEYVSAPTLLTGARPAA